MQVISAEKFIQGLVPDKTAKGYNKKISCSSSSAQFPDTHQPSFVERLSSFSRELVLSVQANWKNYTNSTISRQAGCPSANMTRGRTRDPLMGFTNDGSPSHGGVHKCSKTPPPSPAATSGIAIDLISRHEKVI